MRIQSLLESVWKSVTRSAQRFPMTHLFSVALTFVLIYMVLDEQYRGVIIYYLASGFLLSLLLELWREEVACCKHFLIAAFFGHLLLAIDTLYLWQLDVKNFDTALYISRCAVEVALLLGVFYLSFLRQKNDIQSWNFVRRLFISVFLSMLVGGVMAAGSSGLLAGISSLFNVDFSYKVYSVNAILWLVLLPLLLFVARIPMGEEKHDDTILRSGFLLGVTRYLFVPLVACYMVVLYGYLFRILFTWTLPKGAVTSCVTVMMLGIVIIQVLLYPTMRSNEVRRFEQLASRWMPMLALPLVALMSVGLLRRLSDYGITTDRLYALTLNVWFYAVCLAMWFTHVRRIHWISLSFGALLLLTSAHPFNYTELTHRYMMRSLSQTIEDNPPLYLPMSHSEFADWIDSLPEEQRSRTYSRFLYLTDWCNRRSDLDAWIESDVTLYKDYDRFAITAKDDEFFFPWDADTLVYYEKPIAEVLIPDGAHRMINRNYTTMLDECSSDSLIHLNIVYKTSLGPDSLAVAFSIPELRAMQREALAPKNFYSEKNLPFPIVQPSEVVVRRYRKTLEVKCDLSIFLE